MNAARGLLYVLSASYVLSAVLLARAGASRRYAGAWLATGTAGIGLTAMLQPGRWVVWALLLAALGPWMVVATRADIGHRNWAMTALDVGGLVSLALGMALAAKA